jgi:hypothetical protein
MGVRSYLIVGLFTSLPLTREVARRSRDGGREYEEYNKGNIPLARMLRKNMTPWERKLMKVCL